MRRCLGLFLITLALAPTSAAAHASWVETNPDHGATLDRLPAEATVTVSETPKNADVVLQTPDGTVNKLQTRVAEGTITAELPSTGPRGDYTLSYRVVSADGHPITGSATFTITTGPEPSATPTPTDAASPVADAGDGAGWSSLAMAGGAALVALATGLLFWLMRR